MMNAVESAGPLTGLQMPRARALLMKVTPTPTSIGRADQCDSSRTVSSGTWAKERVFVSLNVSEETYHVSFPASCALVHRVSQLLADQVSSGTYHFWAGSCSGDRLAGGDRPELLQSSLEGSPWAACGEWGTHSLPDGWPPSTFAGLDPGFLFREWGTWVVLSEPHSCPRGL